jgi:flagellar motility protein MotE (MotC chaperone)
LELDHKARAAIEDIINRREGVNSIQTQLKEDIKAIAEYLAVKPAQVARIISLVERERAKGDVLEAERGVIDAAESMIPVTASTEEVQDA